MNDAVAECHRVINEHSKSFSLAARLLPPAARDSAVVVYAWCRRADDAIDACDDSDALPAAIARLRRELDGIAGGAAQSDPILEAFRIVTSRRRIPFEYPIELVAGMEMDITTPLYESVEELLLYCHRAAGVVGLMMCHVLGVSDDRALVHAAHLGIAMQLTNICRDVEEDWRRGRCYVPQSLLGERKIPGESPTVAAGDMVEPVRRLLALADNYYVSADAGMRYLDGRTAWAIRTARLVYSRIGRSIARQGYDVSAGRAVVSKKRKALLLLSAGAATLTQVAAGAAAWRPRIPERVLQYADAVRLDGAPLSIGAG